MFIFNERKMYTLKKKKKQKENQILPIQIIRIKVRYLILRGATIHLAT